jgi:hypothetical protein
MQHAGRGVGGRAEHSPMAELSVPELAEDPFREHYRRLIYDSLLHAAESRSALEREHGHRLRARRAEKEAERLRDDTAEPVPGVASPTGFGRELRSSIRMAWLATLVVLAVDVVSFGTHSLATAVADLGLIAFTAAWFWVCADDLIVVHEPQPEQLELFS